MWLIYNIAVVLLMLLATPVFLFRLVREEGFGNRIWQSLGFLSLHELAAVLDRRCIWIHAASVGEMVATSPIVKEIKRLMPDSPVLVSVVTAGGYNMARNIIPEADVIMHFPIDLPWIVNKVVNRIAPRAFVMVETELWPNFLAALRKRSIPVMMVNGRISDKSVRRYRYLGKVLADMLSGISLFAMQSGIDAEHIVKLGADPKRVVVTGNTKFDQTYTEITREEKQEIYSLLQFQPEQPVIVAGSTHKGEEELLLAAYQQARQTFPGLQMILAPRDILRAEEIRLMALQNDWKVSKRTALAEEPASRLDIVILDTIGELGKVYCIGDIIFVGGSLVPHGGHNILEPAAHGKPVLVGPHMFNFKEIYALLTGRGCCLTVNNQRELTEKVTQLLADSELRCRMGKKSLAVVDENRGAAERNARHLRKLLEFETESY